MQNNGIEGDKIDKFVEFPLTLDLKPYCSNNYENNATDSVEYSLVADIIHHGQSSRGGHYNANVKAPDYSWLHKDDMNTTPIEVANVLKDSAYVLFYVRNAWKNSMAYNVFRAMECNEVSEDHTICIYCGEGEFEDQIGDRCDGCWFRCHNNCIDNNATCVLCKTTNESLDDI